MKTHYSPRLNEQFTVETLENGLTLILYPMPAFRNAFAAVTARIGSVDSAYATEPDVPFIQLPDGMAHFLEHKLFENEDGDAFEKYAKTGANANAYTSFSHTSYHFTATDHFEESLRILLDFVTQPYFTPESVAKEQGIIGQEIEMYDDDPEWQGYSMLMGALYSHFPLGKDIAGSRESIAQITAPMLHQVYQAFYSPHNLVMTVVGRFDADRVRALCKACIPIREPVRVYTPMVEEPREIVQRRVEREMAVSMPMFQIGFKLPPLPESARAIRPLCMELLLDMLVSDVSSIYRTLYDGGLINDTFSHDVMSCRDQWACIFSGESRAPDAVFRALCETFDRAREEGLDPQAFERSRRAIYGRLVKSLGNVESVASTILDSYYANASVYDIIEQIAAVRLEDMAQLLQTQLHSDYAAMSVILPQNE